MTVKKTGWPFQDGFVNVGNQETHVFTDYRWDNGLVTRRWHIEPDHVDPASIFLRPFSLEPRSGDDQ